MMPSVETIEVHNYIMADRSYFCVQEARCMTKARRLGVLTPVLYAVDTVLHTLTFEYVEGPAVKDVLLDFGLNGVDEEKMTTIAVQIGVAIAKLHDGGLVHGDLTTSNMLIQNGSNQLVRIQTLLSVGTKGRVY